MALIQCPECQKEYSEHASSCPNCGYSSSNKKVKEVVEKTSKATKAWLMLIGGILLALGGIFVLLTGSLEKFGYIKTIGCFVFGIGLIASGIKMLKE